MAVSHAWDLLVEVLGEESAAEGGADAVGGGDVVNTQRDLRSRQVRGGTLLDMKHSRM
jgi:hypothetical protein